MSAAAQPKTKMPDREAIVSAGGEWFACPVCKEDLPKSSWADAHLLDGISIKHCSAKVRLPAFLPTKGKTNNRGVIQW